MSSPPISTNPGIIGTKNPHQCPIRGLVARVSYSIPSTTPPKRPYIAYVAPTTVQTAPSLRASPDVQASRHMLNGTRPVARAISPSVSTPPERRANIQTPAIKTPIALLNLIQGRLLVNRLRYRITRIRPVG